MAGHQLASLFFAWISLGGCAADSGFVDGHLQFNMTVGELTEAEMEQTGAVLEEGHRFLLELVSRELQPP